MNHMFWIDLEMTGLNSSTDKILEIAALITDKNREVVSSFETTVFQAPEVLNNMDAWCKEHHGNSGLIARVANGISENDADEQLVQLVNKYFEPNDKVILCGNSVWQDRRFIERYLPKLTARLHYRMLDVSAFKIVFENFFDKKFTKQEKHRALDDIKESISEFNWYFNSIDINKLL